MTILKKTVLTAACVGAMLFAGGASAAGTQTLTPTANVLATCVFTTGPYSMPFGNLSPGNIGAFVQTTTLSYQCTNGTAASSIKVNTAVSPTTVNIANGTSTLPVLLSWAVPATLGQGIGPAIPVIQTTITGNINASDVDVATAGNYTGIYNIDLLP